MIDMAGLSLGDWMEGYRYVRRKGKRWLRRKRTRASVKGRKDAARVASGLGSGETPRLSCSRAWRYGRRKWWYDGSD